MTNNYFKKLILAKNGETNEIRTKLSPEELRQLRAGYRKGVEFRDFQKENQKERQS
jgi:hypothetical protein